MATVEWSDRARQDLLRILAFVAENSPNYAHSLADRLLNSVKRLAVFPESGRVVPEPRWEHFREIIAEKFRILYRYDSTKNRVDVAAVVHGARNLRDLPPPESAS